MVTGGGAGGSDDGGGKVRNPIPRRSFILGGTYLFGIVKRRRHDTHWRG